MGTMRPHCLDGLQIRLGHFFGFVVGMAHLVAAELAFSANFARTCHGETLPERKMSVQMSVR
jgi:hypothetical protein